MIFRFLYWIVLICLEPIILVLIMNQIHLMLTTNLILNFFILLSKFWKQNLIKSAKIFFFIKKKITLSTLNFENQKFFNSDLNLIFFFCKKGKKIFSLSPNFRNPRSQKRNYEYTVNIKNIHNSKFTQENYKSSLSVSKYLTDLNFKRGVGVHWLTHASQRGRKEIWFWLFEVVLLEDHLLIKYQFGSQWNNSTTVTLTLTLSLIPDPKPSSWELKICMQWLFF